MYYHPLIGITIFIIAIIFSFILGRLYFKNKLNFSAKTQNIENNSLPKGEICSSDAPWLNEK
ncbi:MAG: hypothetical protein CM15mP118_3670 [Alphaproteobacteria bacterium]|nr:MAG: hypothetical protein CM15mP118_3670 [Alphaproteobacteria bacterium]